MTQLKQYRWPLIGGTTGLVIALLLFSIGFGKTIVLLLMVALGVAVGLYLTKTGLLDDLF